jgi:WD40 repeat protein
MRVTPKRLALATFCCLFVVSGVAYVLVWLIGPSPSPVVIRRVAHEQFVSCLAFSPDGQLIASGGGDEAVKIWEFPSLHRLFEFTDRPGFVDSVAFSRSGTRLAVASDEKMTVLRNAANAIIGTGPSGWKHPSQVKVYDLG